MNIKYIFNTENDYYGDIFKAAFAAMNDKKEFMLFNDIIYFLFQGSILKTEMSRSDIIF